MADETTTPVAQEPATPSAPLQLDTNSNGFFIRVNQYRVDGQTGRISPTNRGIRINPMAISHMLWLGQSTDGHEVFTIYFINGLKGLTDWAGTILLDEYGVPTEDVTPV